MLCSPRRPSTTSSDKSETTRLSTACASEAELQPTLNISKADTSKADISKADISKAEIRKPLCLWWRVRGRTRNRASAALRLKGPALQARVRVCARTSTRPPPPLPVLGAVAAPRGAAGRRRQRLRRWHAWPMPKANVQAERRSAGPTGGRTERRTEGRAGHPRGPRLSSADRVPGLAPRASVSSRASPAAHLGARALDDPTPPVSYPAA